MFYGRESIAEDLKPIRNKISGVIRIPMPSYKNSERWTDEFRIRDGHVKLEDGTWVTEVVVEEYLGELEKSILDLYDSYQKSLQEKRLLLQQRREMEYGLRVAEKSLKNSLALTKEMIDE
jgi:hypothetical protein